MSLWKDVMPFMKEPHPPPQVQLSWILPSLFAAFNVVLLVVFSGLFFAFPCRWLAQNGEWTFPILTGVLFVLAFFSLVSLNFSDPGILHQGSNEQSPMMVHVVWVNHRAFRLQWCQKCCFHRPPRTYHCPWCNICVEDFDHHCKWVNNCIGHRNFRFFMLLVLSLCLYSCTMLATCLVFLVRTAHMPFSTDKAIAIVVAVPAAGFLVPLLLLLLVQAKSVSAGERSYEGKNVGKNWKNVKNMPTCCLLPLLKSQSKPPPRPHTLESTKGMARPHHPECRLCKIRIYLLGLPWCAAVERWAAKLPAACVALLRSPATGEGHTS
ncbi:palmitoyltransferase ZDHHC19 isoform X2 [Talpa occidentalis]|uniref:palmitoyltransferase ZDHHC19 isoform X2 n=1 Tax=Talpa occidentalis TaxID=50954 RepID=UPI0023F720C1|nr:palmitoyltransferase ZDHHC19 isoform X2 [Talpa occidentalis]